MESEMESKGIVMNKVTVIIPNYNGEKYIEVCLESLFAQISQHVKFEVIVVDNGSKDASCKIIQEKYPKVQLIQLEENTGFCNAVNVGIEQSNSAFVILLNNDTKVLPGFVEALTKTIEEEPKLFAVSSQMLMWDRTDLIDDAGDQYNVFGWAYSRGKGKSATRYEKPATVFAACGGAAIYRKSILEEIGLFDNNHFAYLEDIDICYRARIYGYSNCYEPKAKVLHAGSASTGSRYNEFKTKMAAKNSIYMIWKNMPILQLIINMPFLLIGFFIKWMFYIRKKMGTLYIKGLKNGIKLAFSQNGKKKKVPFRWKNSLNYIKIQFLLYINVFRMLYS